MVYGIGFPELLVIYVIAALVLVGIVVAIVRAMRRNKRWRSTTSARTHRGAAPQVGVAPLFFCHATGARLMKDGRPFSIRSAPVREGRTYYRSNMGTLPDIHRQASIGGRKVSVWHRFIGAHRISSYFLQRPRCRSVKNKPSAPWPYHSPLKKRLV